jgi:hypothetical protein
VKQLPIKLPNRSWLVAIATLTNRSAVFRRFFNGEAKLSEFDEDARPLKEPFWMIHVASEAGVIDVLLRRRFPGTYALLLESLEKADPFDIVYRDHPRVQDNPDEYSDVVREIIVLLSPVTGGLNQLSPSQIEELVREGLARCFDEPPDEERLREAVNLIVSKASAS